MLCMKRLLPKISLSFSKRGRGRVLRVAVESLSSFFNGDGVGGACVDEVSPSSSGVVALAAANTSHAASSTAASASIQASASAHTCSLSLTYSASVAESHLSASSRAFLDDDGKEKEIGMAE